MHKDRKGIVLIGMPGCGKSTVGVILAKILGYKFIDSDLVIQEKNDMLLDEIIKEKGAEKFNQIENKVNGSIETAGSVIATGGSAVYGTEAMLKFKNEAKIVYIELPYEEIERRLGEIEGRGISMKENQTLFDIYNERRPLYEKYADITVDTSNLDIKCSAFLIKEKLGL